MDKDKEELKYKTEDTSSDVLVVYTKLQSVLLSTNMLTVKKVLNELKRFNTFQEVISQDEDGNVKFIYLRYNRTRRKFYLENDVHDVHRITIGKRQAEVIVAKTLNFLSKSSNVE